jgi:hypothetical protein
MLQIIVHVLALTFRNEISHLFSCTIVFFDSPEQKILAAVRTDRHMDSV